MSAASQARRTRTLAEKLDQYRASGQPTRKPQTGRGTQVRDLRASNDRLHQMLGVQSRFGLRAEALLDAGRELLGTLDSTRIHRVAVDTVEQSMDPAASAFAQFNDRDAAWNFNAFGPRAAVLRSWPHAFGAGDTAFSPQVLDGRMFNRPHLHAGAQGLDGALLSAGFTSYVVVPVTHERARRAALLAAWADDYVMPPEDQWFLESLSLQVGLGLHNAAIYRELADALAALRQNQSKANHAHRLQALGHVASDVAHDFNNSLTTILGLSDWLLHELPSDTPFYADLDTIRTAAQDAAAIARRLQVFSRFRPDAGAPDLTESIALADVARAAGDAVRPRCQELAAKSGHRYGVVIEAPGRPTARGSAAEIRELIVNLVVNSLDALPEGGDVRVLTRTREGRPEVAVIDAGVGMTAEVQARVFEPFFSTKSHKGHGLGLNVCATIAERHGASLSVESEPNTGTTVVLTFPVPASDPADSVASKGLRLVHASEAAS
jgi:signal transduction histidine kinase